MEMEASWSATSEEKEVLISFYCLESHQYFNGNSQDGLVGRMERSVAYSFMNVS